MLAGMPIPNHYFLTAVIPISTRPCKVSHPSIACHTTTEWAAAGAMSRDSVTCF